MGPYAFFVLGSYAVTALVVGALILRAVIDHRAQLRALAELESRGTRRRSAGVAPTRDPIPAGQAAPAPAKDPVAAGQVAP